MLTEFLSFVESKKADIAGGFFNNPFADDPFFGIVDIFGEMKNLAVFHGFLGFGCWVLAVGYWLLAVGCWVLAVGCWVLAVGCWVLGVGCWLLAVGFWPLAIGCWRLAVGFWPLAIGYWLLAVGGWRLDCQWHGGLVDKAEEPGRGQLPSKTWRCLSGMKSCAGIA